MSGGEDDSAGERVVPSFHTLSVRDFLQRPAMSSGDMVADDSTTQIWNQLKDEKDEVRFDSLRDQFKHAIKKAALRQHPEAPEEHIVYAVDCAMSFLDTSLGRGMEPVERIVNAVISCLVDQSMEFTAKELWYLINEEVYNNSERYTNYFSKVKTNIKKAEMEPQNPDNPVSTTNQVNYSKFKSTLAASKSHKHSTSQNKVWTINDAILKVVLKSLANILGIAVCFFDMVISDAERDWSEVFLPEGPILQKDPMVIFGWKMSATAAADMTSIKAFLSYEDIQFPDYSFGGAEDSEEAYELLKYSYNIHYRTASYFKQLWEEMTYDQHQSSAEEDEQKQQGAVGGDKQQGTEMGGDKQQGAEEGRHKQQGGHKLVLTGSARERYHVFSVSDKDYMVEMNTEALSENELNFTHNLNLPAHLALYLSDAQYCKFASQHPELKGYLTQTTTADTAGGNKKWFFNASLIKSEYKKAVTSNPIPIFGMLVNTMRAFQEETSPALTLNKNETDEVDLVVSLKFSGWPTVAKEWIHRKRLVNFPSKSVIDQIVNNGFYMVPKASDKSVDLEKEWRLSFSIPECLIIDSFDENQSFVYYVLRSIHSHFFKLYKFDTMVSSYRIKTAMFWMCESWPAEKWKDYIASLSALFSLLAESRLPHYFIPTNSLDFKLSEEERKVCQISLRWMITRLPRIIKCYIITPECIGLLPRRVPWQFDMLSEKILAVTKSFSEKKEDGDNKDIDYAFQSLREYGNTLEVEMQSTKETFTAKVISPTINQAVKIKRKTLGKMPALPVDLVNAVVLFTTRLIEAYFYSDEYRARYQHFCNIITVVKEQSSDAADLLTSVEEMVLEYLVQACSLCKSGMTPYSMDVLKQVTEDINRIIEPFDDLLKFTEGKERQEFVKFTSFAILKFHTLIPEIMDKMLPA